MVEFAIRPLDGVMALLAGGRESGMRHRTLGILVIGLMTRDTKRAVQGVVVVDVAVSAGSRRNRVRSSKRKSGLRVVEFSIRPLDGVVALLASRRESGMRHRTLGVVVIVLVTRNTRDIRDVVVVIDVTIRALSWGHRVRTGQRERRL